jgi:hypothetical protein
MGPRPAVSHGDGSSRRKEASVGKKKKDKKDKKDK